VAGGLDRVQPQRGLAGGQPAVGGGPGHDHIVALADLDAAEDALQHALAGLDVDALVADPVAVQRRGEPGGDVGDPDVGVAQQGPAVPDRVGLPPALAGEQVVQPEVVGLERMVGFALVIGEIPDPAVDQRGGQIPVVQQRGIGEEALLPHQLLEVQPALRVPVLRVPLGRDRPGAAVVDHVVLPSPGGGC
jgi:hypothetical protein